MVPTPAALRKAVAGRSSSAMPGSQDPSPCVIDSRCRRAPSSADMVDNLACQEWLSFRARMGNMRGVGGLRQCWHMPI